MLWLWLYFAGASIYLCPACKAEIDCLGIKQNGISHPTIALTRSEKQVDIVSLKTKPLRGNEIKTTGLATFSVTSSF